MHLIAASGVPVLEEGVFASKPESPAKVKSRAWGHGLLGIGVRPSVGPSAPPSPEAVSHGCPHAIALLMLGCAWAARRELDFLAISEDLESRV